MLMQKIFSQVATICVILE